jgi:hypothetical protein
MANHRLNLRRNSALLQRRASNRLADVAAAMDGRARAPSNTETGLLGRQLASITETLAKTEHHRQSELQRSNASMSPVPSESKRMSLSPDVERVGRMGSGDSRSSWIDQNKSRDAEERTSLQLSQLRSIAGKYMVCRMIM